MTALSADEETDCRRLVELALAEDLGAAGDLTSRCLIPAEQRGRAAFAARVPGVLAGVPMAALVASAVDPALTWTATLAEGAPLRAGTEFASLEGSLRSILAVERTALNFLQRLSGIASLARRYVEAVAGLPVVVLDTRKTAPGWRRLEKYAVRVGGATNHRFGLYDGILIKDNHIAGLNDPTTAVRRAVALARAAPATAGLPVEVEVDTLPQLEQALAAGADMVLLDNMSPETMRSAVARRNALSPTTLLEASGGVNLSTVRAIAETGVDRISVGAMTHSATSLDIGLDYLA